jgi:prepilin-type N-terminal cleavage/methylation domain-containing protein
MSLRPDAIQRRRKIIGQPTRLSRRGPLRQGFTMLEFIVAMIVLGIALTGLFPLEVMQSRVIESLELRYTESGNQANLNHEHNWNSPVMRSDIESADTIPREDYGDWYLIPSTDPLARKLGAAAALSLTDVAPPTPAVTLVDDDAEVTSPDSYTETGGGWTTGAGGYGDDVRRHELQSPPTDNAVWTFSNVSIGRYKVLVTWPVSAGLTTNAQYYVKGSDSVEYACQAVNQTSDPDGGVYKEKPWQVLLNQNPALGAQTVVCDGVGTIVVRLSSNATAAVVADAVRIVPAPTVLSLEKSFNREEVTVHVKIPQTP